MLQKSDIQNVFSVDVEDYYHVSGFARSIRPDDWDGFQSRVVANTLRILDILGEHSVQATFFVLGWVADREPRLIREIEGAGHEIGCHSYWHRLVYDLTPDEFRKDVVQSRDVLEQLLGRRITAYRSPSFSITERSLWALDILVEEGFRYDSSIFPVRRRRYGIPAAELVPHRLSVPAGLLWEFPPSVLKVANLALPISGGGYFRLYPVDWTIHGLSLLNERLHRPFLFYIHPWEIDSDQPRLHAGSMQDRFRHYVNLASTERKLHRLLDRFRFGTISDAITQLECMDGMVERIS